MAIKKSTFITFCVDIGRGDKKLNKESIFRDFALYEQGLRENVESRLPLIVHTSSTNITIPEYRNEENLRYNYFDIKNIEQEFPNFDLYAEHYKTTSKDYIAHNLFYYTPLVVLKLQKMIDAIKENPFGSDYFFWIDCFLSRGMPESKILTSEEDFDMVNNKMLEKVGDKFLLFNGADRPFGFFWGGSKEILLKVYEDYFNIFFESLPTMLLTEELIFRKLIEVHPEYFNVVDITPYGSDYKKGAYDYLNWGYDSI